MKNIRLQMKVNKAKAIANLPFEYDPKDTTLGVPSMTVEQGMAKANRLALNGVASVSQPNLYRLRGGK
jgi:hypothetical protein